MNKFLTAQEARSLIDSKEEQYQQFLMTISNKIKNLSEKKIRHLTIIAGGTISGKSPEYDFHVCGLDHDIFLENFESIEKFLKDKGYCIVKFHDPGAINLYSVLSLNISW